MHLFSQARFFQFAIAVSSCAMLQACSTPDKADTTRLIVWNKSLDKSNQYLEWDIGTLYSRLKERMTQPGLSRLAARDFPKAVYIRKLTNEIVDYINEMEASFKKMAGYYHNTYEDDDLIPFDNDTKSVRKFFQTDGHSMALYTRLSEYRDSIFKIHPRLPEHFRKEKMLVLSAVSTNEDFTKSFFNQTVLSAITMLNQAKHDCRAMEYNTLSFIWESIAVHVFPDSYFSGPFIGQTAYEVQPSGLIEISAGTINDFKKIISVDIDGKKIPLEPDGTAIYRFNAQANPGNYEKSVTVIFVDKDTTGYKQTISYTVQKSSKPNQ